MLKLNIINITTSTIIYYILSDITIYITLFYNGDLPKLTASIQIPAT